MKTNHSHPWKIILWLLLAIHPLSACAQQNGAYIYGLITTKDQHTYTGPIRWGNEEVFWTDIFNSTKSGNDYLRYLQHFNNKVVIVENEDHKELLTVEVEEAFNRIHTYECQFGDISSLKVISDARVDLQMKNNFVYHLKNGSNDVGATIRMMDDKEGLIKLPWDKIEKVEFTDSPVNLPDRFGDPLIGTVHTTEGIFTGLIEWDQDERLTTDILNGDTDNEEMGIPFGTIRSIIKHQEGSQVVMVTGDEVYLTGSNDVNNENRGIVINVKGIGRIKVAWNAFIKITFNENALYTGPGYSDFPVPSSLKGTVFTKAGQVMWGGIVYDFDEAFDTEFLQGKSGEIEYQIPFRNIRSIVPLNDQSSEIQLISGEKLTLSGMQDVSSQIDGILIIEDTTSLTKIDWSEVMEVRFK